MTTDIECKYITGSKTRQVNQGKPLMFVNSKELSSKESVAAVHEVFPNISISRD